MSLPHNCRMQIGSFLFKFDIIAKSKTFNQLLQECIQQDRVRDVTNPIYSNLNQHQADKLPFKRYINIVQKSSTWLNRRLLATGTASSVGKYIKSCRPYPSLESIKQAWCDKINKTPFQKTHAMAGHMNWGVGYEDPALLHFAKQENVGVAQVGTVLVTLKYILALGKAIFKDQLPQLSNLTVDPSQHLLISPDGIVGKPNPSQGQNNASRTMYKDLLGMLEIKCISPFHHLESTQDGESFLEWVPDMEKRQWFSADSIPYVYMTQMSLQAVAGIQYFKMKSTDTMWFIRWSPHGFSTFKFSFKHLVRMGVLSSILYFSMCQRTKTIDDVEKLYPLTYHEKIIDQMLYQSYIDVCSNAQHTYTPIDCYNEFDLYREITRNFLFKIPEMDPDTLQIQIPTELPNQDDQEDLEEQMIEKGECII